MRVNKWWKFRKQSIYNDMLVWDLAAVGGLMPAEGQRKDAKGACARPRARS